MRHESSNGLTNSLTNSHRDLIISHQPIKDAQMWRNIWSLFSANILGRPPWLNYSVIATQHYRHIKDRELELIEQSKENPEILLIGPVNVGWTRNQSVYDNSGIHFKVDSVEKYLKILGTLEYRLQLASGSQTAHLRTLDVALWL